MPAFFDGTRERSQGRGSSRLRQLSIAARIGFGCCVRYSIWIVVVNSIVIGGWSETQKSIGGNDDSARSEIVWSIYPAVPNALSGLRGRGCSASQAGNVVTLGNDFLALEISVQSGVVSSVLNKTTGDTYVLNGDQTGFGAHAGFSDSITWSASAGSLHLWEVTLDGRPEHATATFTTTDGNYQIELVYTIDQCWTWAERRIIVENADSEMTFDHVVYGNAGIRETPLSTNILNLGLYDRPRLIHYNTGGLFCGVGWWFYSVDQQGTYQNPSMDFAAGNRFEGEPWYVGVFQEEAGEPFAGWLWYKTFLRLRKQEHNKHSSWACWNAGWGQWGVDVNNPQLVDFIPLMSKLGMQGICLGSGMIGLGIPGYINAAQSDEIAISNLALMRRDELVPGILFSGQGWSSRSLLEEKLQQLDDCAGLGYKAFHFDFFSVEENTYPIHRSVTEFFRAAWQKLEYTECHLGMATYGPQFQREVLVNHPTDISDFDIGRFSSDWATFCAFRSSRAQWQRQYQYLMPESGLYYFMTHYSNWGHPKQYSDPEPQQFIYAPQAYTSIAFNFHDTIGFRNSVMAGTAFSPFLTFGYLDRDMPERDITFARECIRWVSENAEPLSLTRVCRETDDVCVVSKIRGAKGAVFILNYKPGKKILALDFQLGTGRKLRIRQVYPLQEEPQTIEDGGIYKAISRGESVVILDVNDGLRTLPPMDSSLFPVEVTGWERCEEGQRGELLLPDTLKSLHSEHDSNLPQEISSLDQKGQLPEAMLDVFAFRDKQVVDTWKFAPWAYGNRLWLVYRPDEPIPLGGEFPDLRVNGQPVPMIPRVNYRDRNICPCPLFFADVTEACRLGEANSIVLSNLNENVPAACSITSGARGHGVLE